jgi:hypothetical protein
MKAQLIHCCVLLHLFCCRSRHGHLEVVRLLLRQPGIKHIWHFISGTLPRQEAQAAGHAGVASLLAAHLAACQPQQQQQQLPQLQQAAPRLQQQQQQQRAQQHSSSSHMLRELQQHHQQQQKQKQRPRHRQQDLQQQQQQRLHREVWKQQQGQPALSNRSRGQAVLGMSPVAQVALVY